MTHPFANPQTRAELLQKLDQCAASGRDAVAQMSPETVVVFYLRLSRDTNLAVEVGDAYHALVYSFAMAHFGELLHSGAELEEASR